MNTTYPLTQPVRREGTRLNRAKALQVLEHLRLALALSAERDTETDDTTHALIEAAVRELGSRIVTP